MTLQYREESESRKNLREWRQTERKQMIDSIQQLISQATKLATARYTRSDQRTKWTRLAGQLIWYKDQLLRNMTFEALEVEVNDLKKRVIENEQHSQSRNPPPPWSIARRATDEKDKSEPAENPPTKEDEDTESLYSDPASSKPTT